MSDVGAVTMVRFQTSLAEDDLQRIAMERSELFEEVPGLINKFYFGDVAGDGYGAVYLWESLAALAAFRESELFGTIADAYEIEGSMQVDVGRVVASLR